MCSNIYVFKIKLLLIFLFTLFFLYKCNSQGIVLNKKQTQIEVGLNFGVSCFLGDLGGHAGIGTTFIKDLNWEYNKLSKGAYICIYPNDYLGVRLSTSLLYLEGADAAIKSNGPNESSRKNRNLDFKSKVTEANVCVEIYPINYLKRNVNNFSKVKFYSVIGVGIFHFNPQGSITDINGNKTWYYLQPLHTEGQGMKEYGNKKEYKLTQINIPIGAGFKFLVSPRVNIFLEFLYRKTFTDYIDDVSTTYINASYFSKYLSTYQANLATQLSDKSLGLAIVGRLPEGEQRGDVKKNDTYFTFGAKISIQLGQNYSTQASKNYLKQVRCYSNLK